MKVLRLLLPPAGVVLLPVLAVSCAAADAPPEAYRQDVEYLLRELPARAGHFFPTKGIDWQAVSNQFTAEVRAITNDAQHLKLCQRLLARLQDGHARLTDLKVTPPDESRGRRWTGPRVHLLESAGRVYVRQAFGPAAERGLRAGMEVTRIDGMAAGEWLTRRTAALADETGYSTAHQARYAACHWGLADWSGTSSEFQVLDQGRATNVTIVRAGGPNFAPIGPIHPPKNLRNLGRQSYGKSEDGLGYIHLRDVPGNLPEQLDTMLAALADAPRLILDLRANGGGGCDHAAVFGRFVSAGTTWRQYLSAGASPFGGPMVVIVDAGTRSAGETVAGMLKEDGRAYLIGDTPTAGTSSSKTTLPAPSGLFAACFSVRSNLGRCNGGRGIEGIGVPPHELMPYDAAELARGVDTQIRRAGELLETGLPADKVPFEALRKQ